MIGVGSRVRWKKVSGMRINQTAFLAMGDVVMVVVRQHPMIGYKGSLLWLCRSPDGYEDWVPESEIWELNDGRST